jgi:hypothetical protein
LIEQSAEFRKRLLATEEVDVRLAVTPALNARLSIFRFDDQRPECFSGGKPTGRLTPVAEYALTDEGA